MFGPEITAYLDTFHTVKYSLKKTLVQTKGCANSTKKVLEQGVNLFCFLKLTILVPEYYRYEGYKKNHFQDFYLVKLFYQFLKHLVLNDINHSAGNAFVSEKPDLLF